MNSGASVYLNGFTEELGKIAQGPAAAGVAIAGKKGVGHAIIEMLRKRPLLTAATGAAAGAGAVKGIEEKRREKDEMQRKRERIRQILMARLAQGGYYG